jgi:hypothetical protein
MKLAYILILLVLLFIAGLYIWNTVAGVKRVPIYREDEIRYYPVVEYPINEYPYYYGWWWPWYGGSYNIVGSRYGSMPPYYRHYDGHSGGYRDRYHGGLPGIVPPAPGATPGGHSSPSSGATAPSGGGGHAGPTGGGGAPGGGGGHGGGGGGGAH